MTLAREPNGTDTQDAVPFLKSHLRDPLHRITQPIAAQTLSPPRSRSSAAQTPPAPP